MTRQNADHSRYPSRRYRDQHVPRGRRRAARAAGILLVAAALVLAASAIAVILGAWVA